MMNDYFLQILIRQRHEIIMAEYRGDRLLQPEWPPMTNRLSHKLRRLIPTVKLYLNLNPQYRVNHEQKEKL